ncbi:hypothetical protein TNCV_635851 [Trichonephila clavipes]|nr:hypothetical protein TNCV_635851 [Trichonephila clavipes]
MQYVLLNLISDQIVKSNKYRPKKGRSAQRLRSFAGQPKVAVGMVPLIWSVESSSPNSELCVLDRSRPFCLYFNQERRFAALSEKGRGFKIIIFQRKAVPYIMIENQRKQRNVDDRAKLASFLATISATGD